MEEEEEGVEESINNTFSIISGKCFNIPASHFITDSIIIISKKPLVTARYISRLSFIFIGIMQKLRYVFTVENISRVRCQTVVTQDTICWNREIRCRGDFSARSV